MNTVPETCKQDNKLASTEFNIHEQISPDRTHIWEIPSSKKRSVNLIQGSLTSKPVHSHFQFSIPTSLKVGLFNSIKKGSSDSHLETRCH